MTNKAAAFTVVSVIGLCNLIAFVLFTSPAKQMAFSYLGPTNETIHGKNNTTSDDVAFGESPTMMESSAERRTFSRLGKNTDNTGRHFHSVIRNRLKADPLIVPNKTPSRSANANANATALPLSTVEPPPSPHVDTHNYSYIINQPDLCNGNDASLLVILVCTSINNIEARQSIRETWGGIARNASGSVRLAFLLGSTTDTRAQELIREESVNYLDLIQEDFLDTYNNLTLKSVMMLKWVTTYCPRAQFLLKTDDDMFIHVSNLLKYLQMVKKRKRLLFGRLMRGARPFRQRTSKWFAPVSTYRERVYPDYLSGTAYAMSVDVARGLLHSALRTPLFHLEDVFITGICARRAGIPRRHCSGFTYERRTASGCAFRNAISGHKVSTGEMRKIWAELNLIKRKNICR